MDLRAGAALLFTCVIWGIGPVFIRTMSVVLGPADHLAIRYFFILLGYGAALAVYGGWRIERADLPRLFVVAFVGMLGYALGSAFGFRDVSAGIGSLIIGTQPLLIALLGTMVTRERLSVATVAGLILAFAGTALLVWNDVSVGGENFLLGAGLVFGAGIFWAIYVVACKPLVQKYGSYSISALTLSMTGLAVLALFARPGTLDTAAAMTTRNWLEMAYLVVPSTLVASITWNWGAARLPAAASGAFIYFVPVIGVLAGALMLDEVVTTGMLVGGALILLGVAIAQFAPLLRLRGFPATG